MRASNAAEILPRLAQGAEVLLIRLRSLGDIVLTTPALEALHAWRPDLRTVVAVEPAYAAVLEGNPSVGEVFLVGRFLPAAARLARRRFPVTLNQHGGPTSALLTAATLSPVRVAWQRTQFSFLANVLVSRPKVYFGRRVHTAEQRISQFWQVGLPRGPVPPARVYPQPDALAAVSAMLVGRGIGPGRPYVVLQPGAAFASRRWALGNFAQLADWLAGEWGLVPVVLLGPRERELGAEARKLFGGPAVIVEGLALRRMIALVSQARLFVGQDTGPTHVAAAAGCPVVDIFGSSNPVYWGPWATPSRIVLNEFPCRPCRGDRCYAFEEPRCILSVTIDQVKQACRELLLETGG
ncbi:MAG TPA: glycosyltransferase family 9 protein [Patescibacteria group bacterium]|nr:glycosyltransferase family 9 protein [Patescibacteria group bacterium]